VHEEGGSQTPGAYDKNGEVLPLQRLLETGVVLLEMPPDLDSQGAIPLAARDMDKQDSSRTRSMAPNRPLRISCKMDEGKVSIPPCIAHASG
jgi:hypothetical protein